MKGHNSLLGKNWINRFKALAYTHPKIFKLTKLFAIALVIGLVTSIAIGQIVVRYWIWPELQNKKSQIEQFASKTLGVKVTITDIQTSWVDLRPAFEINNLIFNSETENQTNPTVLEVPKIRAVLGWDTIWKLTPSFYDLKVDQADINAFRNQAGDWFIAGVAINNSESDFNSLDWLLEQRDLQINNLNVKLLDQHDKTSNYLFKVDHFETKNFQQNHQVNLALKSAWSPEALSIQSEFKHRLFSNKGNWQNWQGTASWHINQFNLAKFLNTTHLPIKALSGNFNTKGNVELNNGKLSNGEITLDAENMDIYWEKPKNTLRLSKLNGTFTPTAQGDLQYHLNY